MWNFQHLHLHVCKFSGTSTLTPEVIEAICKNISNAFSTIEPLHTNTGGVSTSKHTFHQSNKTPGTPQPPDFDAVLNESFSDDDVDDDYPAAKKRRVQ